MKVIGNDGSVREATGEDLAEVWRLQRRREAEILREEQEAWDEGLALKQQQELERSALGQFEELIVERIPDGFGRVVRRVRRAFKPPGNF